MDNFILASIINAVTLNQRNVYYQFKKETGINKACIEILTFADTMVTFNPYEVQKRFDSMNLQQVRISIIYLNNIGAIELIRNGIKNKPAIYVITKKGQEIIRTYAQLWIDKVYK